MQKNSKKIIDPELVIETLIEKGVKISAMATALGIERSSLTAWRRSVREGRRTELAKKLMELWPEHFQESEAVAEEPKYVQRLEAEVERLTRENERLYAQLMTEIVAIKKMLGA